MLGLTLVFIVEIRGIQNPGITMFCMNDIGIIGISLGSTLEEISACNGRLFCVSFFQLIDINTVFADPDGLSEII